MPKKMTLEKLAQMIQKGFADTATKAEFREIRERIDALEKDTAYGFDAVNQELKQIKERIQSLDYGPEVHDLRIRVERLERKVGMRK